MQHDSLDDLWQGVRPGLEPFDSVARADLGLQYQPPDVAAYRQEQ